MFDLLEPRRLLSAAPNQAPSVLDEAAHDHIADVAAFGVEEDHQNSATLDLAATVATPLPTKTGETFVIDDFDNKVTQTDHGFNYFGGNTGEINNPAPVDPAHAIMTTTISSESNGSVGGSLDVTFNFLGQPNEAFGGYFASLFGLTDTLVSLDGGPPAPTPFPDYFLDTEDIYRDFLPLPDRSVDEIRFDIRLETTQDVTLKIELKDEDGFDVFTRRIISHSGNTWQTISLALPTDFNDSVMGIGNPAGFNWREVSTFALIVENENIAAGVDNEVFGRFLIDNLALVDADGEYPNLNSPALRDINGDIRPEFTDAFLDLVRARSFQYFLDFASTDSRTGGIIQDRSSFADLMTVGGVGFQLTAYVIGAERGYISRADASQRVHDILEVLESQPQGFEPLNTIGYQGFFYHFLGIDGLRKLNFDFEETEVDESLNTVELSTIDTALAMMGILTAAEYFDADVPNENQIRTLASTVYDRVNWRFMLNEETNQFYLGWKPDEVRDDDSGRFGRFKLDVADGPGQYSSKPGQLGEEPATLDFYTDEGLLVALLAMASPNPQHRVDSSVFFSTVREDEGGPFVKTFPGSLFTYQFAGLWLDTAMLGSDLDPSGQQPSVNYFDNTQQAILAAQQYASDNPLGRATLGEGFWGLSATEGPFDTYFAEAAPDLAIHPGGQEPMVPVHGSGSFLSLEGEDGAGDGSTMFRSNASGVQTVWLHGGESRTMLFDLDATALYEFEVRYSNDNFGPLETVTVKLDGVTVGAFDAQDTGNFGFGWNNFLESGPLGEIIIPPGQHGVSVFVEGGDGFGVEIDIVSLTPKPVLRPLEVGTVTNYAVAASLAYTPQASIDTLWAAARRDLNQDSVSELLHPRFGFADAFNINIADAAIPGTVHPDESRIFRTSGPWANFTGFSIDHGPMVIAIDNFLNNQFIPGLFMSHPTIRAALDPIFPGVNLGAPPAVKGVITAGGDWAPEFLAHLQLTDMGDGGFSVPDGSGAQLTTLPWHNIDRISIVFSEAVSSEQDALSVFGVNQAEYAVTHLATEPGPQPGTFMATWAISGGSIGADKLLVVVDDGVQDLDAILLDGEWLNPSNVNDSASSVFSFGDGLPGGDFQFRINVLPGDITASGMVDAADYTEWANRFGRQVGDAEYDKRADLNADGMIDGADYTIWANHFGEMLPGGEPTPLAAALPATSGTLHSIADAANITPLTTSLRSSLGRVLMPPIQQMPFHNVRVDRPPHDEARHNQHREAMLTGVFAHQPAEQAAVRRQRAADGLFSSLTDFLAVRRLMSDELLVDRLCDAAFEDLLTPPSVDR